MKDSISAHTNSYIVDLLQESELSLATTIINDAFSQMFKKLLGETPPGKSEGDRVSKRFYRPGTRTLAIRDSQKSLKGVCFIQYLGNHGIIGPLAMISQGLNRRSSFDLVIEYLDNSPFDKNIERFETVTFPHSPLHAALHFKGLDPLFPNGFFVKKIREQTTPASDTNYSSEIFSLLANETKTSRLKDINQIIQQPNLTSDISQEIQHVFHEKLGETILVLDGSGKPQGFAICHFGNNSESFADDQLLIKHLHISSHAPDSENVFNFLLTAIENLALKNALSEVAAMGSMAHRALVESLQNRRYLLKQIHTHWCRLQRLQRLPSRSPEYLQGRKNVLAGFEPESFILKELR